MHTIAQILTFPHKTKCTGLRGRIVKVGKWINGNHQEHGPWSFQDLEVQDDTGKMIVCLEKHDELPQSWRGVDVVFTGGERDGAPTGLIADDHTPRPTNYQPNPQPYRRLRVTQAGRLTQDDGQEPQGQPQQRQQTAGTYASPTAAHDAANGRQTQQGPRQQAATQQQRPQQQRPAQQPAQQQRPQQAQQRQPNKQPPTDAVKAAKALAARIAVCKQIAYNASVANAWAAWEAHGIKASQEGVGAEASGIFIEMMRKMPHDIFDGLPYLLPHPTGRRLIDLYDLIDEARAAEIAHRQKAAADAPPGATPEQINQYAKATRPAPQQRPAQTQPAEDGAQWEENESAEDAAHEGGTVGEPGETWKQGLEDDDIPF